MGKKKEKLKSEEIKFEEAIGKLELVVNELEDGGLTLDQSIEKFTNGMKLIRFCQQELNQAEQKIEQVIKENDEFKEIVPFAEDE